MIGRVLRFANVVAFVCGAIACSNSAMATGITNGNFENATAAPWRGGGDGRRVRIPAHAQYGSHVGVMGKAAGVNHIVQRGFDCVPPGAWCNVTFDASFLRGNAGNQAIVVLQHGNGRVVGIIPVGAATHTIAIQDCKVTDVIFILNNAAAPRGMLLVDNVGCVCSAADGTDIKPGSEGQIPQLPAEDELPEVTDPDCNTNDNADILDILEGGSLDQNSDGVPDECKAIPTLSEWGMVVMALLIFTVATIVIVRRRRPAAAA